MSKIYLASMLIISSAALSECGGEADAAHQALVKASAAIKVPSQLDSKTTLTKVSMPEKLTQEFEYDISPDGRPLIDEGFDKMITRAKTLNCMANSHVVKFNGKVRYTWRIDGKVVKQQTIAKSDCGK